jgi:hypothetical protein
MSVEPRHFKVKRLEDLDVIPRILKNLTPG